MRSLFANPELYKTDKGAAKVVEDAVRFAENNRAKLDQRRRSNLKLYHMVHDLRQFDPERSQYPYESKLCLPTAYTHVEGVTGILKRMLLANSPMCLAVPTRAEDTESARRVSWYVHHQFVNDIEIHLALDEWLRGTGIVDTAALKVTWQGGVKRKVNARFDPSTGRWVEPEEEYEVVGAPSVELVDWRDVYYDPWARNDKSLRFVCHRLVWTPEQLEAFVKATPGKPWNEAEVKAAIKRANQVNKPGAGGGSYTHTDDQRLSDQTEYGKRDPYSASQWDQRLLWLYDYWEPGVHILCVTVGGKRCILREPNPYEHGEIPFVFLRWTKALNQFEGISVMDVIRGLVAEKNARRNQRMDNVVRQMNPLCIFNRFVIDPDLLASRPAGLVPARGSPQGAITWDRPPPIPEAYQETALIDEEIREASGWTEPLAGQPGPSREPARSFLLRAQHAGGRLDAVAQTMAAYLTRVVKMVHALNRQFLREDLTKARGFPVWVGGSPSAPRFETLTYDDLNKDYEWYFTLNAGAANPALRHQSLVGMLSVLASIPQAAAATDWEEVIQVLWETLGYRDDARRFVRGASTSAQRENEHLLEDGVMPPPRPHQDHREHIEAHLALAQSGEIEQRIPDEQLSQAVRQELDAHLEAHAQLLRMAAGEALLQAGA